MCVPSALDDRNHRRYKNPLVPRATRSVGCQSDICRTEPWVGLQSSTAGGFRVCLVAPRARFSLSLRWRADFEGFVERRPGGSGRTASSRTAFSLRTARLRLVAWDRDPSSVIRTSTPSLSTRRFRTASSNIREASILNLSSARVELLFACWPPGPPDGPNRHCSSESGISNRMLVSPFSGLTTRLLPSTTLGCSFRA